MLPIASLMFALISGPASAGPEMIPEADLSLEGRVAPPFEVSTLDGGTFNLEDHRGKIVVMSFWASWCSPCRLELPALDALQKERDDLYIVAVNVDRDRAAAERFLNSLDIDLPVAWDNEALALGLYDVLSMPTMYLIDANGTVKFKKVGFSREKGLAELEAKIAEISQ